jgi:hypothetical protein
MWKSRRAIELDPVETGKNRLEHLDILDRARPLDDEKQFAFGQLQRIGDVERAIAGVHGSDDGSNSHCREENNWEFDPIRHPDANDVSFSYAAREERSGSLVDLLAELVERKPGPTEGDRRLARPQVSRFVWQVAKSRN